MPRRRAVPKLEDAKLVRLSPSTVATLSDGGTTFVRGRETFWISERETTQLAIAAVAAFPERFSGVLSVEAADPTD